VPRLLEDGHEVVATFSRGAPRHGAWWADRVTSVGMDVLDPAQVEAAVEGVDAIYFLIHGLSGSDFAEKDRRGAAILGKAAAAAGVERIVYLSGLVPDVPEERLSEHIASRLEVERVLASSGVPVISARAAIVIGSGSTSFEIVRQLSERLPVQTLPTWMDSEVQPIAAVDVVEALAGCLALPAETRTFDVGGPERMRYAELLQVFAEVAGIVRPQVPVPLLPSAVVGQLAGRLTGVPTVTVASLVESLHHDMVCRDDSFAAVLLPDDHVRLGVREAIRRALTRPRAGTRPAERDPMGALPTDPPWAGGGVYLFDGQARRKPVSLAHRLLLGVRRPEWLGSRR
jgi:uncharacterized protein YbjT (DUF2867 family)